MPSLTLTSMRAYVNYFFKSLGNGNNTIYLKGFCAKQTIMTQRRNLVRFVLSLFTFFFFKSDESFLKQWKTLFSIYSKLAFEKYICHII